MAAAKDDPVSVEDKDNIEALLDDADRLSSTISRPFSGLSTVLARIRAASIAQKKELDATLEVCQQMQKKVDVAEATTQDILNQVVEQFTSPVHTILSFWTPQQVRILISRCLRRRGKFSKNPVPETGDKGA